MKSLIRSEEVVDMSDGVGLVESVDEKAMAQAEIAVNAGRLTTESEWALSGTKFFPQTRADKSSKLPPGVYRFAQSREGWWLERTSAAFEFPFKVYHASGHIINRIKTYWKNNRGNLGILMNGLRGAGKTMTAQLLSNDLIEELGVPVLVVRGPIPLQVVFDQVQQDMIVIFDEFEKTHDENLHPGAQQSLLSTIDGMSRSSAERLIIFTTNSTNINENFRDRPSRIHYRFEFSRVADEIIDGLIDDSLPADLQHFKPDIFEFLNSRKICTIDIVKAVIAEVNTFRESPLQFEDMLNVAKGEPPAYTVEILNPKTNTVLTTFSHFFRLDGGYQQYAPLLSGNKRSIKDFEDNGQSIQFRSRTWDGGCSIVLLEKTEEEFCWLAQLCGSRSKTIYKDFEFLGNGQFWLDNKPEGWKFPFSRKIVKDDPEALERLMEVYENSLNYGTAYGTGERATFKVRISPERNALKAPTRYKADGVWSDR
jgi:hypothetical protein